MGFSHFRPPWFGGLQGLVGLRVLGNSLGGCLGAAQGSVQQGAVNDLVSIPGC